MTAHGHDRQEILNLELFDRIDLHRLDLRTSYGLSAVSIPCRAVIESVVRYDSRRTHHVEDAGSKAEQKKYYQPPRRNPEQPVDQPAETGADQHACNKFTREPEASRVAGCSRRPIFTRAIGRPARLIARKPFAEPLEPRGESGLIGVRLAVVAILARAVTHPDTRGFAAITARPPLEAGRTILTGFRRVKKRTINGNPLKSQ
jgi:hypothetical protein